LSLPRAELHEGINTLTLVVTNGRGETDRQALAFVATPAVDQMNGLPTLGQRPDWQLSALPTERTGWVEKAGGRALTSAGEDPNRGDPAARGVARPRDNAFWIGTRRERSGGRRAAHETTVASLDETTARLRRLQHAIQDEHLRPVNRAAPPSPAPRRSPAAATESSERPRARDRTGGSRRVDDVCRDGGTARLDREGAVGDSPTPSPSTPRTKEAGS